MTRAELLLAALVLALIVFLERPLAVPHGCNTSDDPIVCMIRVNP